MSPFSMESSHYKLVTLNYWAFTLSDGALRLMVVLYFYQLGYSPLSIAMLFVLYEFFGVVTNLLGGWLGARLGLNRTMNVGLALQVVALSMLLVPPAWLSVTWVMAAQALSGIAKDLNKMSAKSSIKLLVPDKQEGTLFRWVSFLTGSKNTLKGVGFFLGGALLSVFGFRGAIALMTVAIAVILLSSLCLLRKDLGRAKHKPKFSEIFSRSRSVNVLSAARMFLFGSRDVWFVVALPVFLAQSLGWSHTLVGSFLALWVIGYGVVQALAPRITRAANGVVPDGGSAFRWAAGLACIPALIAAGLATELDPQTVVVIGLLLFGVVFAINSALHSYLIVSYASSEAVSVDVGFYYMANAMGRLLGTVLSGWVFQQFGFSACLWVSAALLVITVAISAALPKQA